jgi:hypothetical protein
MFSSFDPGRAGPTDPLHDIGQEMLVYLFGDIHYKDIFNNPHITQYCGIYVSATNKFEDCGLHNKVD